MIVICINLLLTASTEILVAPPPDSVIRDKHINLTIYWGNFRYAVHAYVEMNILMKFPIDMYLLTSIER